MTRLIALVFLALLAACSERTVINQPVSTQGTGDVSLAALGPVNRYRAEAGLGAVTADLALARAARDHAEDMIANRFFGHGGTGGTSVGDRATRQGYGWCFIAENIAQGHPGLIEVIDSWMTSPGHRANILAGQATQMGVYHGDGNHWVMVLGQDGC